MTVAPRLLDNDCCGVPGFCDPPQSGVVGNDGVLDRWNIGVVGEEVGADIGVMDDVGNGCGMAAAAAAATASLLMRCASA